MLLPKIVVDDHGGTRTDAGMLGAGIYFASSARWVMKTEILFYEIDLALYSDSESPQLCASSLNGLMLRMTSLSTLGKTCFAGSCKLKIYLPKFAISLTQRGNKLNFVRLCSAWNKYFASGGHHVQQSALRTSHSQFVPVFCIWYTIEIWKPAVHCDRQKTNPVGHTWNRAGQSPMIGAYFMHWDSENISNWILKFCLLQSSNIGSSQVQ